MSNPPRQPSWEVGRETSLGRPPLAQRSASNRNSTSTIRLVPDEDSSIVYSKTPFPVLSSQQLLPPRRLPALRYAPFVSKDPRVSDENSPSNTPAIKDSKHEALAPKPQYFRRSNRFSTSTNNSDADASILTTSTLITSDTVRTPTSSRISSRTTPPSSPVEGDHYEAGTDFGRLEPVREEIVSRTPSSKPGSRPTIRAVVPSASNYRLPLGPLIPNPSDISLDSSGSSGTLPVLEEPQHDREAEGDFDELGIPRTSGNFETYDLSSPGPSSPVGKGKEKEPLSEPDATQSVHDFADQEPLAVTQPLDFAVHSSYDLDRPLAISALPSQDDSHAPASSSTSAGAPLQYPTVTSQSIGGSWAESPLSAEPAEANITSPRMRDEAIRPQAWSSRLSTIASESDRSQSHTTSTDSRRGRRRRTLGSEHLSSLSDTRSSEWEYGSGVLTGTDSHISIPIPQPLFSPRTLPSVPDEVYQEGKDADEQYDVVGELQPPPLRQQRSGILTRFSSKSSLRPGSSDSVKSHASQISFVGDLFWARRYYSTGEPANMIAANAAYGSEGTSTPRLNTAASGTSSSPLSDTIPSGIWRPRNRPRDGSESSPSRRLRAEHRRLGRPSKDKARRISRTIAEESAESVSTTSGRRRRSASTPELSVAEMMWSPHLHRDRREARNRYSAWSAPSFEEPGNGFLSPTNRQIFFFALGFLLPPAWWIASLLPVGRQPYQEMRQTSSPTPGASGTTDSSNSSGQRLPESMGPSTLSLAEKRYQKAAWWRRVNRILSFFGLLVIGAVIALAIIGTRRGGLGATRNSPLTVTIFGTKAASSSEHAGYMNAPS